MLTNFIKLDIGRKRQNLRKKLKKECDELSGRSGALRDKTSENDQLVNQANETGALIRFEFFDGTSKGAAPLETNSKRSVCFLGGAENQTSSPVRNEKWEPVRILVANATVYKTKISIIGGKQISSKYRILQK